MTTSRTKKTFRLVGTTIVLGVIAFSSIFSGNGKLLKQNRSVAPRPSESVCQTSSAGYMLPASLNGVSLQGNETSSGQNPSNLPNAHEENLVEHSDTRRLVTDTTHYPYSTICKVISYYSDDTRIIGTGTLFGPRHVLTARHVIYSPDHGGWAKTVYVKPGYNSEQTPFGYATQINLSAVIDSDYANDIGIIITSSDIGKRTGWMGVKVASDGELNSHKINIIGYPNDRGQTNKQFYVNGNISSFTDKYIFYKMATDNGESGAGLYERIAPDTEGEEEQRYIVAVHDGGSTTENFGARVTDFWAKQISKYRTAYP